MALSQLVYVSRMIKGVDEEMIRQIIVASGPRNASRDISGILLWFGRNFLQLLEGEEAVITALYERIACDPRHEAVERLLLKPIARRMFPEWGMEMADVSSKTLIDRPRLLRMVNDIRQNLPTQNSSLETRVLINDYRQQLTKAA